MAIVAQRQMLKMVITARRNRSMTRPEFFRYLREEHWPTVRRHEKPYALLLGYLQNHALGPAAPASLQTPFRLERDRDSVIELWFESDDSLVQLVQIPEYLAHVRPDEAVFNDLPSNIMVRTAERAYFHAATVGRCKRFDFIARGAQVDAGAFAETLDGHAKALALDPFYTAHVDRHVHNLGRVSDDGHGFGTGSYDCVREVSAASFEALSAVASMSAIAGADLERSFTVLATEFVMKPPPASGS